MAFNSRLMQYLLCFITLWMSVQAGGCTPDNCLRAMRATSPTSRPAAATSFCNAFTQSTTATATTNIPPFAATACSNNVVKLSSACSCLPTPTPTICSSLIQNSDFSQGPTQDPNNIPHWTLNHYEGHDGNPYVQNFGSGNEFWFKYENDGPVTSHVEHFSLEQSFVRCPGVTYNLTMDYLMNVYIPENHPVTINLQVGLYGSSAPQTTAAKSLYYYCQGQGCSSSGSGNGNSGVVYSNGPWTVPIPALSTVPVPGDDGVRMTLSYYEGTFVEMYILNITLLAL